MADQKLPEIKRQTAYKCSIADLRRGNFVKKEGWESNYVMTDYGDFSRINIIGVIVSKEDNAFVLEDGTDKINARMFENTEMLTLIGVGDLVLCVARPREFNNEIYLTIEIIKKIDDPRWVAYRKKELSLIKKIRDVTALRSGPTPEPPVIESPTTLNAKEHILKLISEIDDGSGASIDAIIKLSKVRNAEEIITDLLLKGEIFEIKAGRVKALN